MRKRQRQAKQFHNFSDADCPAKGRFRKRDAFDCGRPQCQLCHGEKIFARPSANQRRANEAFAAGMLEVSSN